MVTLPDRSTPAQCAPYIEDHKNRVLTVRDRTVLWPTIRNLLQLFVMMGAVVPTIWAQADVQGQWSTASYQIPINPIHSALLNNGKILVIAGSGNCPPSM